MVRGRPQIRLVCGTIIALFGLLWIGQGLDLMGLDGGMNGEPMWAVIGAVALVFGVVVAISGAHGRRRL